MPIGNDVVDLRDPETLPGALHPRFDARVFSPAERRVLEGGGAVRRRRWRLWAAKEAAYKAARKLDPTTRWSPVRFAVRGSAAVRDESRSSDRPRQGRIDCPAGRIRVQWEETREWIHALAWTEPTHTPGALRGVAELRDRDQSLAVRQLARQRMAAWLGRPVDQLQVRRLPGPDRRIPSLWIPSTRVALDLSLSHHGQLVAFACVPPEGQPLATGTLRSRCETPGSAAPSQAAASGGAPAERSCS